MFHGYLPLRHGLKAIDFLLDRRPRLLLPPSMAAFEEVKERSPRSMALSLKEKGLSTRHILWAACRSDQTSADARIGQIWHGAFTYYLCQNINKSENKLTRKKATCQSESRSQEKQIRSTTPAGDKRYC